MSEAGFNEKIFDCLQSSLSTIGMSEKDLVLGVLKEQYQISSKNAGKEALRLDETLKGLLGPSVSAFVIIHFSEYVSSEFKFSPEYGSSFVQAVETARRIYEKTCPLGSQS